MADLLFISIVVAFFGLMVLLVKGCDRIIGSGLVLVDAGKDETESESATEKAA